MAARRGRPPSAAASGSLSERGERAAAGPGTGGAAPAGREQPEPDSGRRPGAAAGSRIPQAGAALPGESPPERSSAVTNPFVSNFGGAT